MRFNERFNTSPLSGSLERYRGVIAMAIVIIPFMLTRLPFYLYYPMVTLSPDSWTYAKPAYQMLHGAAAAFDHRTPGYPLFIALVHKLFTNPSNMTVVMIQCVINLASLLFLVYVIYRRYPGQALYAALAISGYASSVTYLWYESNYMTESLYVSFLVLLYAFLILAAAQRSALIWAVVSFVMGYIVWIRPAGVFILLIGVLAALYLIKNHYPKKTVAALIVPCAMMLVVLAGYNRFTIGSFTVSPFGVHNLFSLTIPFMDVSERFPSDVNKAIVESVNKRVSQAHRHTVMTSWDITALREAFDTTYAYNLAITFEFLKNIKPRQAHPATALMGLYPVLNDIAIAQLRNHPLIYLKFVGVMLSTYLTNIRLDEAGVAGADGADNIYKNIIPYAVHAIMAYHNTVAESKDIEPMGDRAIVAWTLNEYLRPFPPKLKNVYLFLPTGSDNMTTEILYVKDVNSPLMRASTTYQRYHHMIFRNSLWVAVNFAALGVGILILWRRRLRDREAFIIVALSAAPLLSAIVTSAVTTAMVRYSYPTEIGNYLGAALLPILWRYHFLNIKNTPPASIINPTI